MLGGEFTWCNNQEGEHIILSLIDRCLANTEWLKKYPNNIVEIMEKGISDHCPLMIDFEDITSIGHSHFKFLNVVADHPDFMRIVKEKWEEQHHKNGLLNLWFRCKSLKHPLKQLNNVYFRRTSEKVNELRSYLVDVQKKLNQNGMEETLIQEEKQTVVELEKWSDLEEQIWRQKSRVDWIKLGDSNTKFFHAYARARQSCNAIKILVRADGTRCKETFENC